MYFVYLFISKNYFMYKDNTIPKVSVFVVTYNHENFISQCIDSILMQKTNFEYEIVIGEDKSTDNTLEICRQYAIKHKNIKLIESEKNIGLISNWIRTIKACTGKYIAMCEGDDYWLDLNKLQIQVDFMDGNSEYVMCFTNTYLLNDKNGNMEIAKKQIWDSESTLGLLQHNDFLTDDYILPGHTSSLLFRNNLIEYFPKWLLKAEVCDLPLILMLSRYGMAKFINIPTSVYRQHEMNLSSINFSFFNLYNNRIYIYSKLNIFFNNKFNSEIKEILSKYYVKLSKISHFDKNYMLALKYLLLALLNNPLIVNKSLRYIINSYYSKQ